MAVLNLWISSKNLAKRLKSIYLSYSLNDLNTMVVLKEVIVLSVKNFAKPSLAHSIADLNEELKKAFHQYNHSRLLMSCNDVHLFSIFKIIIPNAFGSYDMNQYIDAYFL